jgi:hypothetical protein
MLRTCILPALVAGDTMHTIPEDSTHAIFSLMSAVNFSTS